MSGNEPRVSIGMPLYNAERYLAETLESLLVQTFQDFELVISDNGSSDRTEEICRSYAARDNRIRYYRGETNRGAAWNHNRVFELSRGEYFKWACYDDPCAPAFLEKCIGVLDQDPSVALCYTSTVNVDDEGQFLWMDRCLLGTCTRPHERLRTITDHDHNCHEIYGLIRSSALRKTRLIGSYCASDQNLLADLALRGKFHEVPEVLLFVRVHRQGSCRLYGDRRLRTVWFDTSAEGKLIFPYERQFWEYLLLIGRAPLPWLERLRCYLLMVRWLKQYGREAAKSTFWGAYWGAYKWVMVSIKKYMPWVRTAYLALTKPAGRA
jgi:glycosyltransferase involved in cell wall biosynthesis